MTVRTYRSNAEVFGKNGCHSVDLDGVDMIYSREYYDTLQEAISECRDGIIEELQSVSDEIGLTKEEIEDAADTIMIGVGCRISDSWESADR